MLNAGVSGIGSEGGFGGGVKGAIPGVASNILSALIPGPLGGLLGNLAGKLFGGLFGGHKKKTTKAEAIPVYMVNWSDLASAMLNVSKQSLLGATTGRIDRLNNLRIQQSVVGI